MMSLDRNYREIINLLFVLLLTLIRDERLEGDEDDKNYFIERNETISHRKSRNVSNGFQTVQYSFNRRKFNPR